MRSWPGFILFMAGLLMIVFAICALLVCLTDGANADFHELIGVKLTAKEELAYSIAEMVLGTILLCSPWLFVRRRDCTDCPNKTRERDEHGLPLCEDCEDKREERELIRKAEEKAVGQPKLKCPFDGTVMTKLVLKETEIVVDYCPECKCALLEADEIEELEEALDQPSGGGSFTSGFALGQSMSTIMHAGR